MDAQPSVVQGRSPLWEESATFILPRLEEAGVRVSHRRFEAKEVIYTYGDPDRYLYFLTEGSLKLYKRYAGHKEAIVSLLEEGSVFGEPAPRAGGAHRDSAQAASACRVAVVDKAALEHHVQQDPRCALALLVAYAQWVQRHERAFARLIPREIRARLAGALLEVANRFGESTSEEGIALGMHLTHQTLAEMIVSSREGVSKEMARFGREGLVETRGKAWIVLLDEARLTEITRSR